MVKRINGLAERIFENKLSPSIERYLALSVLQNDLIYVELTEIAQNILEGANYTENGKELVKLLLRDVA